MHTPALPPLPGPLLDDDPPLWRLLLDPRGRIGRATWWRYGFALPLGLGLLLLTLADIARLGDEAARHAVNLLLLWPAVAVSAKRWHDTGRTGWWVLVVLLPLVGWLWALVANGLLRGTPGLNAYGPEPADVAAARATKSALNTVR